MYDCENFIDDYAVDPMYRNDLSFIFLLNLVYSDDEQFSFLTMLNHNILLLMSLMLLNFLLHTQIYNTQSSDQKDLLIILVFSFL